MQKIIRIISGFDFLEHTTEAFIYYNILPFTKMIEFNVSKLMRQFECNKLPEGFFQNEWSSRLFKGGDGFILRDLNDLNVQRTIPLDVDKMT